MKAVITNRIYLECDRLLYDKLDKELTYVIPSFRPEDPPLVIKNMGRVKANIVTIPIGRVDLIPEEYNIVDRRVLIPTDFPEFRYTLRESQERVYNTVVDNVMINAPVSWGKTFTALSIAAKLKQKTLVITHTVALRNQWEKEIKKVFGIEPSVIGSQRIELAGPIVVGNIQTLYRNIDKIKKAFGTIILDECHHVSAATFSKIIDSNHARYKIGLSGTLKRKDGKHVVFADYFSKHVIQPPEENSMQPTIDIIPTNIRLMDGANIPWANRVTSLANNEEYRHLVSLLAATYAAKGHKILIVSDRVSFLQACAELTGDKAVCIVGKIDSTERERLQNQIISGEKTSLYGTLSIYKEGISVNPLSCLILATPINNDPMLEQLIGRIKRTYPNKMTPVVVDIHWKGKTAMRQASARMAYYMKQGYKIRAL
jgi:superfamily II DNA or RNA helicase